MTYSISKICPEDKWALKKVTALLEEEGIMLDQNVDYMCCMFDEDYQAIATGSCFGNTLRCFAVSGKHQGEGLLNQIVSHLMQVQFERGNYHLFLYTKCETAKFFRELGFYEIARVDEKIVFMENKKTGFANYLKNLRATVQQDLKTAAIVMNANPFSLGHQYLIEKASEENDIVHLFVVSEDASLIPFYIRKRLVQQGTEHLANVILHDSGPYMISNATFPSYFLKDEVKVIENHARLDIAIFSNIAKELKIASRYVGEEPLSQVTGIYNHIMEEELPEHGIQCIVVPRKRINESIISASRIRECIKNGKWEELKEFVPVSTWDYLTSEEAKEVIERIQKAENVIHY